MKESCDFENCEPRSLNGRASEDKPVSSYLETFFHAGYFAIPVSCDAIEPITLKIGDPLLRGAHIGSPE
jgi:hypothetical protein